MKALLVISNGRGIIAEADDMQALEAAYAKAVEAHEHTPGPHVHTEHLPAFARLHTCHMEGETGAVCILDTAVLPHAANDYYLAGFVD